MVGYKSFGIAVMVMWMSGCAHSGSPATTKPDTEQALNGTYLFVSPCRTSLAAPPETKALGVELAAALAAGVVKTGIDWVGAALQKAAEDDVEKTIIKANLTSAGQLAKSDINVCLQVVRGAFRYTANNEGSYLNAFSIDPKQRVIAPLQLVEGTEELYIELLPVIHGKFIAFAPLEVRYAGYTPTDKKSKRPRDLGLFVGYSLADKDISAGEYAGRLIDFGTLTPNGGKEAVLKYVDANGRLSLLGHTQWISLPDSASDQPITLAVTIIETRKASQLSKFLAAAFESSKDDIKNKADAAVAELEVFKASKELEKEKLEAEKEKVTSEQAYFDSVAVVLTKEEALASLCGQGQSPDKSQVYLAQKELYFAKKNANLTAAIAGKGRPYTESDIAVPTGKCG